MGFKVAMPHKCGISEVLHWFEEKAFFYTVIHINSKQIFCFILATFSAFSMKHDRFEGSQLFLQKHFASLHFSYHSNVA